MTDAYVLLLVFGLQMRAGGCLALVGQYHFAPNLNVGFSFLTFMAAMLLAAQTVTHGPAFALGKLFFVDPLNVFLVALTAFVGWTTSLFSRPSMRTDRDRAQLAARPMRL